MHFTDRNLSQYLSYVNNLRMLEYFIFSCPFWRTHYCYLTVQPGIWKSTPDLPPSPGDPVSWCRPRIPLRLSQHPFYEQRARDFRALRPNRMSPGSDLCRRRDREIVRVRGGGWPQGQCPPDATGPMHMNSAAHTRPAQVQDRWGPSAEKRMCKWGPIPNPETIYNW